MWVGDRYTKKCFIPRFNKARLARSLLCLCPRAHLVGIYISNVRESALLETVTVAHTCKALLCLLVDDLYRRTDKICIQSVKDLGMRIIKIYASFKAWDELRMYSLGEVTRRRSGQLICWNQGTPVTMNQRLLNHPPWDNSCLPFRWVESPSPVEAINMPVLKQFSAQSHIYTRSKSQTWHCECARDKGGCEASL